MMSEDQEDTNTTDVTQNIEDNPPGPRDMDEHRLDWSQEDLIAQDLPPQDKYNLIYFGFLILGATTLLPWNFFITATDYWMYKFRNTSLDSIGVVTDERSPLQTFFESYLAIASNSTLLITMILNTLYGQKFSHQKRLYTSLAIMFIMFFITTIFVLINTDRMQNLFFTITIALVILISFFSAVFQSAIFGLVASFPSHCMHAMVNGQAMAGLLAVLVQALSISGDIKPIVSGLWYFTAASSFLSFAILCYWLMDSEYTDYYLGRHSSEQQNSDPRQSTGEESMSIMSSRADLWDALQDCWPLAASVAIIFWATLATYPGVCVLVTPQHPNSSIFTGRFYILIVTFFLFNLSDLVGRICSTFIPFASDRKNTILVLSSSRVIIPMLILFCNVQPRYHTPVLISNDIYYPILVTLTGLTNGFLFSAAMVVASKSCSRVRSELTGFIMATSLGIGLTLGSITSTVLLRII